MEETMTIEELERRVKTLEDMEEIKELHREYLFWISDLEIEKALDCFASDIEVEVANYGIRKGKERGCQIFPGNNIPNVLQSKDGHFTGQPVVTVEGGKGKRTLDVLSLCTRPVYVKMGAGKIRLRICERGWEVEIQPAQNDASMARVPW